MDDSGALAALRGALPGLGGARRRVAETILADPTAAGRATITELAQRADTTPGTVTRMATALGFAGFQAFRAAVALDAGRDAQAGWEQDIGAELGPDDSAATVLDVLARDQFLAMRSTVAHLDLDAVTRLADAIVAAGQVHLYGEWGDSVVARELYLRLSRVGVAAWHHEGGQSAQVAARRLHPGDVALAFTRIGDDPPAEAFLRTAQRVGALTAVVTGDAGGPVAAAAQLVLFTGTHVGPYWTDFFAGRVSDSLATSVLWVLVVQRMPDGLPTIAGDERAPAG